MANVVAIADSLAKEVPTVNVAPFMDIVGKKMRTVAKLATLLQAIALILSTLLQLLTATSRNVIETWIATGVVLGRVEEAVLQQFSSSCPKKTA
jgi:hypothetical protein